MDVQVASRVTRGNSTQHNQPQQQRSDPKAPWRAASGKSVSGKQSRGQPQQQPDAADALNALKVAVAAATGAREVMLAVADVRAVVTMLPSLLLR